MRLTKRQRTSLGMSLGFGLFILALTAHSVTAASADTQPQFWRIVDTVYDDELGASWEDQSSCPHDLADTTNPHNGLVSISFTPEAGTGLQFYSPDGIADFGGRYENALSFQLSCSASSLSTLGIQLIGSSSSKTIGTWMPLTSFLQPTYDPTLSSDWLALVAPFASFGIKPLDFVSGFALVAVDDTVQFVDPTYIDDVWILEPTEGTFSLPTPIDDNENNNENNNAGNNDGEDDIDDLKSSGADSSFNILSSLFGNETSEEGSSFTQLVTSSLYIILFLSVLGVVVLGAVIGLISRFAWKQYSYQKIKAKPFVTPMTLYSQSPSPFFSQA